MTLAEPTPPEECDDGTIAEWMARELVKSNTDGHESTGQRIDTLSGDVRAYGKIITLALGLIAGLAGVRMIMPDGTVIESSAASEVPADDMADAHASPPE